MSEDPAPSRRHRDPPSDIGPYRILQTLGEGGMGVVYEAEQTAPVRRRVALKVVRAGYDSRQIVARFEAERQALAVMDHPNIARVYEAGTTEEGLPYFAMELVKGTPITEYCDTQKLSTEERLRLFVPVCRAVQHAHHKGVIHRDLKPSNVLVTIVDRQPVPKVIDFGIAKAMGQDLTDKTLVTELGQLIGTPEYMSPEQAEMTGLDIDTRTDIYSLGVMLYELLVGARPLDLRHVAIVALWKAIREQMPPTPSSRLATLPGETQAAIALYRHTDASDLRKTLQGDLDWVAMKCLEKDRTRRYETANGLAVDLERFLRHEPVVARPPSAGYRLRKFVRRHRAGVAAAVVALVAVSAGSAAAVVGMVSAKRSEERAIAEANAAQEVAEFLQGLFKESDPEETPGDTVTVREILDRGAERVRTELKGQPLTQARLLTTMGLVYNSLSRYDEAGPLLEEALTLRQRHLEPGNDDIAESLTNLAIWNNAVARYPRAESLASNALNIRERVLDPEDIALSNTLNELGYAYYGQGRYEEAEATYRRALSIREHAPDPDGQLIGLSLHNIGMTYYAEQRFEEAEPMYRRALESYTEALGPDHPWVASVLGNLGVLDYQLGKYDDAENYLVEGLERRVRIYGPDHVTVGNTNLQLAINYLKQDRYETARPYLERALAIFQRYPDHPTTAIALMELSELTLGEGALDEAESAARQALAIWEATVGDKHRNIANGKEQLADVYMAQGKQVEADRLYREVVTLREELYGRGHPRVIESIEHYASALRSAGRIHEADSVAAQARSTEQGGR